MTPQLVYLEWLDSAALRGWHKLDTIREEAGVIIVQSIGWLLDDGKDYKTIVAHMYMDIPDNGGVLSAADPMSIPTGVIRKIVPITIPGGTP